MALENLSEKLSAAFRKLRGKGKLSENDIKSVMREVKLALLEADVNYKVVKDFIANVTEKSVGEEVLSSLTPAQQVIKIVDAELTALMGGENTRVKFASKPPTVIMMCGLNGAGKTTHSAKLARFYKAQNHRVLLAALDVYRPAAVDQLKTLGEQIDAPVWTEGKTPEKIAKLAHKHAKDHGFDILILDTAGRQHVDSELMAELTRISKAIDITETLMVVDAMTGQDAVNSAQAFNNEIGLDGIILSKLDGDTRGGAALSIRSVIGKPIKFSGVGEKMDALEEFHPSRMSGRILGMGDMLSLIEKAEMEFDEKEAEKQAKKLEKGRFDLDDLLAQLKQIKKMGSLSSIVSMLPGVGNKVKDADVNDNQLVIIEAMINSMTKKERRNPQIINHSRKNRIAAGSGTLIQDVNRLLKQFEQMQKMFKTMGKNPQRFMNGFRG
jgi:signal recognition particle protein